MEGFLITLNAAGASEIRQLQVPVWSHSQPTPVFGLIATVSAGASLNYSVQVTGDPNPSDTGNWNEHDVLTQQTASKNSNIAYPVRAIRLIMNSYTSGSVTLGVVRWP